MDLPIPQTQKAVLKSLGSDDTCVTVHFNPASMVYTIENSTKQQSGDPKKRQFAAQFSGKLTMDLQFDTTSTGEDVRKTTGLVAKFMQASAGDGKNPSSGNAQAQPVLQAFNGAPMSSRERWRALKRPSISSLPKECRCDLWSASASRVRTSFQSERHGHGRYNGQGNPGANRFQQQRVRSCAIRRRLHRGAATGYG